MPIRKPLYIILISFFCFSQIAKSQEATWELGFSAGAAGYMGDLNQNNPLKFSGLNGGVFAKRNFNPYLGLRLNYFYGQIKADDANSTHQQFRDRNLRFKTSLSEVSTILDFNLFEYNAGAYGKIFTPYIFAGVGFVVFKPKATYDDVKYRLDRYLTEGQQDLYKNYTLTVPYGVGIKYNYKDAWSVFSEIGYRTAFTDYLDDVSGKYPSQPTIVGDYPNQTNLSDPSISKIGVPGTQRGDFRKRDTYLFVSVGISFTFVNSKCYTF
jgi:hypothetical protein